MKKTISGKIKVALRRTIRCRTERRWTMSLVREYTGKAIRETMPLTLRSYSTPSVKAR